MPVPPTIPPTDGGAWTELPAAASAQEEQSAPAIPPAVLRRSLLLSIIASGIGAVFFGNLIGGIFGKYVLQLGLGSALPLLISIFPLMGILQVVGSYLIERLRARRLIFFLCLGPPRLLWLLIGAISLWTDDPVLMLVTLIALLVTHGLFAGPGGVAWLSWLNDLVPPDVRGRYFGFRNTLVQIMAAGSGLAAGWYVVRHGDSLEAFHHVFVVMAICGVTDILLFLFVYHPPQQGQREAASPATMLRQSWQSLGFRRVVATMVPWQFSFFFIYPFILLYLYQVLNMTAFDLQLMVMLGTVFGVILSGLFGVFCDHYGHRTALLLCLAVHAFVPLLYLLAAPGRTEPVWLAFVLGIIIHPVVLNLQHTLIMIHTDRARVSMAFGIFGVIMALVMFLAPNAAALCKRLIPTSHLEVLGLSFHPYQLIIAAGALFRLVAFLLALRLPPEADKPPAGEVFRYMVAVGPIRPFFSLYRFARATASRKLGNGAYAAKFPAARWQVVHDEKPASEPEAQSEEKQEAQPEA